MIGAGYVEVTRASSRQFVDLMSVNDSLGVVSFGDSSIVEYPSPAGMQVISGQAIRDAARAEIDDITFGGCTFMGAGINEASSLLSTVSGTKAIVLLSDGYDNKGCSGDPTRPSALDAIAALPADIPIYSCAMGPLSDQALLEQLGTDTNGQYYFMPTIDDLFEIYNYIRGQVSGDSIIVNESSLASSSRLAGFVDALSSEVTFSVAWNNPKLTYVPRDAKKRNEISIRLRDSRGKLLNDNDSYVRRIVGNGYVIFTITDPMPGQWFVEVSTMLRTHTRYTVGGFVNSPIRLIHKIDTEKVTAKKPFNILTSVFNGNKLVDQTRGTVQIVNQSFSTDDILRKFKRELADIKPNQLFDGDGVPKNVGKIIDLRNALIADGKKDLFEMKKANERLKSDNNGNLNAALTLANKSTSNNLILNVSGSADGTKFIRKDLRSIFAH